MGYGSEGIGLLDALGTPIYNKSRNQQSCFMGRAAEHRRKILCTN